MYPSGVYREVLCGAKRERPLPELVLGCSSPTFRVGSHHYALIRVTGLEPGETHEYEVRLDGEKAWPEPGSPFPPSVIRPPGDGERVKLVFGSCRVCAPQESPYTLSRQEDERGLGVDALYAMAMRLKDEPVEELPQAPRRPRRASPRPPRRRRRRAGLVASRPRHTILRQPGSHPGARRPTRQDHLRRGRLRWRRAGAAKALHPPSVVGRSRPTEDTAEPAICAPGSVATSDAAIAGPGASLRVRRTRSP